MSIALYWMYSSVLTLACGRLHHTYEPTIAPTIAIAFHIQRGVKTVHHDQLISLSSFSVNSREKPSNEENTTNLLALNSWKKPWRLAIFRLLSSLLHYESLVEVNQAIL